MDDGVGFWIFLVSVVFIATLFLVIARLGDRKSDDPTMIIGIRTASTTKSAEHWYQAHRAARRPLLTGAAAIGMCLLVVRAVATVDLAVLVGIISLGAAVLVFTVAAVWAAEKAARQVSGA